MGDPTPNLAELAASIAEAMAARVQPEALSAAEAAQLIGVGRTKLYEMDGAGLLPLPVDVGGCKRWLRRELTAWLIAGCPTRQMWQAMRQTAMRRAG